MIHSTKFEMHFHTEESSPCGKISAKKGVELYKKAGYNGLVVTDHFSEIVYGGEEDGKWEDICERFLVGYRHAKKSVKNGDFKVFLGMEIRFPDSDNDFLVYGINEDFPRQYPWIYMKGLKFLYDVAKEKNLLIVQAHPYRGSCFLAPVEFLHGIEVYNGNPRQNSRNELALKAAHDNGLLKITGSDFHQEEDISGRFFELKSMPCMEQELVELIKSSR